MNYKKHPLITGTIILTVTGLISRMVGFFYRIYLSRLFGEEGMGIYQLTSPVLALTFSLTVAGLQTAISRYVAGETASKDYQTSLRTLLTGIALSLLLSLPCMWIIIRFSEWIAASFLLEPRTASMLRILALSIPLSAVHCCINGYFYGVKKAGIPAATQLIEQFFRVFCVFLADYTISKTGGNPTINAAVVGLVVGEFVAMLVSILAIRLRFYKLGTNNKTPSNVPVPYPKITAGLLALALPLSMNRIVINLLQSIESVYIPDKLQAFGYDSATALSVYGVLTGMALPLIFFPNALTGSISLMLLPVIAEADMTGNKETVKQATTKTVSACLLLGSICTIGFLVLGNPVGNFLFGSELVGRYICSLSFICPSLYLCTTLTSILHGLGKVTGVFFTNVVSILMRLAFIIFLVPKFGIESYIISMLLSQMFSALSLYIILKRSI